MAYVTFDPELKRLAKVANQRMREFEKRGISSPAYKGIQAQLEAMGVKPTKSGARRFSETGKGTYRQKEALKAALKKFEKAKTSTISGSKDYYNDVWKTANQKYGLESKGISKDDYFKIFDRLPDKERDRLFGSQTVIDIVATAKRIGATNENGESYKVDEIVDAIQSAGNLKDAMQSLGISFSDLQTTRSLGRL